MFSRCSCSTLVSVLSRRSNTFSSIMLLMFSIVSLSNWSSKFVWPTSSPLFFYCLTMNIDGFWIVSRYIRVCRFLSFIFEPEAASEFLSWTPWMKLLFISTSWRSSCFSRLRVSTFTVSDLCDYKASFKSFSMFSFIFSVLWIAIYIDSISYFWR